MIYQLEDRDKLKSIKNPVQGDLVIVNDGVFEREYVYLYGTWKHNDGYVCPVRDEEYPSEPSV